ncbi:helix-turn-helix transcriptional regulator [Agrobacterium rosae]|uniref:helix-turn-helix domain-containing protein n=1 Tax=Agrobacterium rosae TaxID=1972867 RepID=UPI0019D3C7C3|nr:helix-turn-helix transcriptional regulator [Agrobacterium rosae]MBN7808964.1 helix-turn-helix transcriptional regulator [Agrobacterium rosae]
MSRFEPLTVEIGRRLEIVRQDAGISPSEFASSLNVSQELYQAYADGEAEMPMAVMRSLYDVHGVNPAWLLAGEQDRYMSKGPVAAQ